MEVTFGKNVKIFARFQDEWLDLNKDQYEAGITDLLVNEALKDHIENVKSWIERRLGRQQIRADYREFLELAYLFVGGKLSLENTRKTQIFRLPGPIHHARWMVKAIYSLKIFLFRIQFKLTPREHSAIRAVCIFIVRYYIQLWFGCTNAVAAPRLDLEFMQQMLSPQVDLCLTPKLKTLLVKKMINHLWYLSEENVALAFFDKDVDVLVKRKMATNLLNYIESDEETAEAEPNKKFFLPFKFIKSIEDKDLSHFVTRNTLKFFDRFGISHDFLNFNPETWPTREDFKNGLDILSKLKVVNDTAERAVKLMELYNLILSFDEEEKQFILQTVAYYHKKYSSALKRDLTKQ